VALDTQEDCELHLGVHRTAAYGALITILSRERERHTYLIEIGGEVYELYVVNGAGNVSKKAVDYVQHLTDWHGGINHEYDVLRRMWENYHGSRNLVRYPEKRETFKDIISEVMLNDWGYKPSSIKVIDTRPGANK